MHQHVCFQMFPWKEGTFLCSNAGFLWFAASHCQHSEVLRRCIVTAYFHPADRVARTVDSIQIVNYSQTGVHPVWKSETLQSERP